MHNHSIENQNLETDINFYTIEKHIDKNLLEGDTAEHSIPVSNTRGPRSRTVEAVLLLLYAKPMKSSDIAKVLGKPSKLVSSYLSYWKTRGYVSYRSGYWMLTKQGEEYVRMFIESLGIPILSPQDVVLLAHKLINEQVQLTVNNWTQLKSSQQETEIQRFTINKSGSKVGKQAQQVNPSVLQKALNCVTKILESKDLLEDEMQILNHLIKHYIEWGSTYLYLDQIAEELHYQVQELVTILRKLQSKRLVYLYTDRRFGIRVGLGKSFKQLLDQCLAKQR
jgi:DNA-binding MarR family transcriptional regulator